MDYYLSDPYEEDGYMFVDSRFPATKEGVRWAEWAEQRMAQMGFALVGVGHSKSQIDATGSLVQSGIGAAVAALTGFGFLRLKRNPGWIYVKFGLVDASRWSP